MSGGDERWRRLEELFARATDLPETERQSFIACECGDDRELLAELQELLKADVEEKSRSVIGHAVGAAISHASRDRRQALIGRVLGNYRLTSVLGHGGTGTVYLAERADRQYSAQVAIKILDASLHGDLGLRFRSERQILASLNHSNIARLLDAGETQEGQPYLVMEYIHGETLDRYCDRNQLDLRARLRLFLEVCVAVQCAHQNLIIHRDLKPANILVTADGKPKLLDFGIAKLLDPGDTAKSPALTRMNDRLLTPEYASPEQILGRAVTTASDVYALGVVLYELMTGLRPYSVPESASQLELERSICVTDPLRPSAAVARNLQQDRAGQSGVIGIAAARRLSAEKLARKLTGDIDAIIMRALRKEPEHRYGSVEQLAADIARFLSREPVQARQGNWLYYSQRFARRHAYGVAAGALVATLTLAFAITMSVQAQRIAAERDRAEQESRRAETVSEFMLDVFTASDPFETPGREVTARELLDAAGSKIYGDINQHPEVRARLLEAIGRAFRRQHLNDRAISHLQEAIHLRKQLPQEGGAKTGAVMTELAIALRQSGDLAGADKALESAVEWSSRFKSHLSPEYADLLANLGRTQFISGDSRSAQKYFEESLALTRKLHGPTHPDVASLLTELSAISLWHDDPRTAEQLARQALEIYRATTHRMHPDRVVAEVRLADTLYLQGRFNEAEPIFLDALADQKSLYGVSSRQVADILDSLAAIKRSQGLLAQAESYARQAVDSQSRGLGADHYMTAYVRTSLAAILLQKQDYAEAEVQLRQALSVYEKALPPDHQYIASSEHLLGEVLLASDRVSDAEPVLRAAMNRWKRSDAPPWRSARSASALGEALFRAGRIQEAERLLADSYRTLALDDTADRTARVDAQDRLARFYSAIGRRHAFQQLKSEVAQAQAHPRN